MTSLNTSTNIVSLAIGVSGLTLQTFHVVNSAFRIYTGASSFIDASSILKAKLIIEENLLSYWGEALGIENAFGLPDAVDPFHFD